MISFQEKNSIFFLSALKPRQIPLKLLLFENRRKKTHEKHRETISFTIFQIYQYKSRENGKFTDCI